VAILNLQSIYGHNNLFLIHSMSLTSIQEEIVRLSSTERAMLIDILWESLDEQRVKEIEAKWAAESEDRIDAVDRGELQTVDGPSALQDLRSSLRK
jgi:putative addiction module component (TIGR02574 family)